MRWGLARTAPPPREAGWPIRGPSPVMRWGPRSDSPTSCSAAQKTCRRGAASARSGAAPSSPPSPAARRAAAPSTKHPAAARKLGVTQHPFEAPSSRHPARSAADAMGPPLGQLRLRAIECVALRRDSAEAASRRSGDNANHRACQRHAPRAVTLQISDCRLQIDCTINLQSSICNLQFTARPPHPRPHRELTRWRPR